MADIALTENAPAHRAARAETTRRASRGDARFHVLTWLAAAAVLLLFVGVIISLVIGSMPALKAFGLSFLKSSQWDPTSNLFGGLPSIYGTLVTSALAMVVAVPVGIGIAIFLTELCPGPL